MPRKKIKERTFLSFIFCVRTTKRIFLLVLRMNSNPCINEILADARVKSANADEIFGFASDEIKSTHSPSRRISPNEVGFHRSRRFHPPARVDLVEKSTDKVDAFFWRRQRDSNPRAFWANGFQDRLVMTTSICLRIKFLGQRSQTSPLQYVCVLFLICSLDTRRL